MCAMGSLASTGFGVARGVQFLNQMSLDVPQLVADDKSCLEMPEKEQSAEEPSGKPRQNFGMSVGMAPGISSTTCESPEYAF